MIPCIETKCLKFPVCKASKTIKCNLLYDHIHQLNQGGYSWVSLQRVFKVTERILVEANYCQTGWLLNDPM